MSQQVLNIKRNYSIIQLLEFGNFQMSKCLAQKMQSEVGTQWTIPLQSPS